MKLLSRISPEWALSIGFAAMYLYSGFDIYNGPGAWTWAVPPWFAGFITSLGLNVETYLKAQAIGEVFFALAFLAWFLRPIVLEIVATFAAAEMAGIIILGETGINSITFRDLGLLGGLVALLIVFKHRRKAENLIGRDRAA